MPKKNSRQKSFERINAILGDTDINYTDKDIIDKIVNKRKKNRHKTIHRKHSHKVKRTPILRMDYLRELALLRIKGKDTATYCPGDEFKNAGNRSDFSVFRGLSSFKFVKLDKIRSFKHKKSKQITFELTKYGKNYVDKYFPKYKRIYHIIEFHIKADSVTPIITMILLVLSSIFVNTQFTLGTLTILAISIVLVFISFGDNPSSIFKYLIKKNLIKKSNLTKPKFDSYLSNHHIKEPSIKFNYDYNMPLINSVIFKSVKPTISSKMHMIISKQLNISKNNKKLH